MEKPSSPEYSAISPKPQSTAAGETDCSLFEDGCILDMDHFVQTIAGIKAKGVRPDLIGSIIAHYASTWLPDIIVKNQNPKTESFPVTEFVKQKRFFVETLIGIIPPEKDSVSCNFLLRLLRMANLVGADMSYKAELEARISWQLDQASLEELMIPSFSHTSRTLLDVELVTRMVKKFAGLDIEGVKSSASLVKVAKLVDSYLAEAAVEGDLCLKEFVSLVEALPNHARVTEDGLYRGVDTYLKAHPNVSKQERKTLCELIDCTKLSMEASLHATQNDRLPVRTIIQILFAEQANLSSRLLNNIGRSGSSYSPNPTSSHYSESDQARCMSKREMNVQHMELKRLREDMAKLKSEYNAMRTQLEKVAEKKCTSSGSKGFFKWKRFGFGSGVSVSILDKTNGEEFYDYGEEFEYANETPGDIKTRLVKGRTPSKWRRKSMS